MGSQVAQLVALSGRGGRGVGMGDFSQQRCRQAARGGTPHAGSSHEGEPREEQGLTDAREGGRGEKEGDSDGR